MASPADQVVAAPSSEDGAELGVPRRPAGDTGGRGLRVGSLALAAVFALPLLFLVQQSWTLGTPVVEALTDTSNLAPLGRSLLLGTSVALTTSVLGTACAWLVARTDLPGAKAWGILLALPLVLPSYIGAFTIQAALAPGGLTDEVLGLSLPAVEGFWAALAILTLLTYPYVFLLVVARLRQLPANLEESARLLGKSPAAIFRRVVLPQVTPAILAGALLVFLYAVSDFGLPQLLRYDTLTRVIFGNLLDRPVSSAFALQLGVLALLTAALERAATTRLRGLDRQSAVRGRTGLRWTMGRRRPLGLLFVAGVTVASLVGPLVVLVYWAVRGLSAGSTRASSVLSDPAQLLSPLLGSATAGILAAVVAAVVVLPIAFLTVRRRGRAADAANGLVITGFALPGLIIALSLSFFVLRGPGVVASLYQTLPLLVIAYVVHFGAQSLRASQVGVEALPDSVVEAARTLGAGRLRRLLRVELPMMLPSVLAGGGLVLLSTLKELPATLLLSPPGFRALATDVWAATQDAFWAEASIVALVLVLLSGVLTWLLVLRRTDALA
ncbi:ABC transporter permease [Euzebya rosea]|uniref:ABC transporter permease n=1 Tax=Euzebya rosea TaxID=2052804 RepID=UPI000D3E6BA9|nr:iron ABC transporter permease [Euzebya rosea]